MKVSSSYTTVTDENGLLTIDTRNHLTDMYCVTGINHLPEGSSEFEHEYKVPDDIVLQEGEQYIDSGILDINTGNVYFYYQLLTNRPNTTFTLTFDYYNQPNEGPAPHQD